MGSVSSGLYRRGRHFVKALGLEPVIQPLYRWWNQFRYQLAGETYAIEIGGARANFYIPTKNE